MYERHGQTPRQLYNAWARVRNVCLNPSHPKYHRYGGRGITLCDSWLASYVNFRADMLALGWKAGLQIDRKNNNSNYQPDNIRLASSLINNRNSSQSKYWHANGARYESLEDAAKGLGVTRRIVLNRTYGYTNRHGNWRDPLPGYYSELKYD